MEFFQALPMLFFPFMLFIGGSYLIFRGLRRGCFLGCRIFSGKVGGQSFPSHLSNQNCIYSKVVIEYSQGGHLPWRQIGVLEKKSQFLLDGKTVDPEYADIRLSTPKIFTGRAKPNRTLLESAVDAVKKTGPGQTISSAVESVLPSAPEQFLDMNVYAVLLKNEQISRNIKRHRGRELRVREYVLAEGSDVCVLANGSAPVSESTIAGSMEFPLLITDKPAADARSAMNEKAYLGILLGGGAILLALVILVLLLAS